MNQLNESTAQLANGNGQLPHAKLNQLEELNDRWKMLLVSCEEREKETSRVLAEHGSAQQQFWGAATEEPWERAVASNKVPYYIK